LKRLEDLRVHVIEVPRGIVPPLRGGIQLSRGFSLDSDALILFTSGTTGQPKGVVHTHRSLRARWMALRDHLGLDAYARTLCTLPTHFGHGLICNCLFPWLSGCDLYIMPPFRPEIMARIGDIYADRDLFAQAAPYWNRIPSAVPGQPGGYLEAASIFWDYFDFDNALRLLKEGRQKQGDDNLYSYEAGAIYENQRDYPHAVSEYIKGSLAGSANSAADLRLLELARRPRLRDLVDQETAKLVASPSSPMSAVYLRVRVLEAQDRKPEMETFLDSVVGGTASIQAAEELESLAERKSLEKVRQHALEKQAALTIDPVNRLQLRYRLVQFYENRNDMQAAQREIEALYRENPKLLGVVRSTVDFYWRAKFYPQAITVLLQAAKDSYPDLGKQFAFEAARKSTEAKQYQQARELLTQLLAASPYDGQYLAAMADTYAQSGDDQGLQQFYLDKITLFRTAKVSSDDRKTTIATLRRGLIPALTRLKDHAGAVDQYVELINNFSEDAGLVTEAARYALRYQRQRQLVQPVGVVEVGDRAARQKRRKCGRDHQIELGDPGAEHAGAHDPQRLLDPRREARQAQARHHPGPCAGHHQP